MATNARKDFPVFDCDSHVVEPPAIWDEYVPARSRAWVKTQFCFHTDSDLLFINGRVVPGRARALERRRGRLGPLGQEGGGRAHARHAGVAGEVRAAARLPRPARAPQGHGRARHRPGDAVPHVVRAPGAGARAPRRRRCWPSAYNDWVLDYCARRPAAAVSLRGAAAPERRGVDRGAPAGGQAGLQGGGGASLLLERALSHAGRVRPAVARVRGPGDGAGHAHVPVARGAHARVGRAHGRRRAATRARACCSPTSRWCTRRASSCRTSPRPWIPPSTPPRRSASCWRR